MSGRAWWDAARHPFQGTVSCPRSKARATSLPRVGIFRWRSCGMRENPIGGSARDDDFLIEPAEKGLLAPGRRHGRGQPMDDLVAPQIQRERLKRGQQGTPQITKRMPPARQRIVDDNNLASRLDHAEDFAERPLAMRSGLLMQKEEQQRLIIAGIGNPEVGGIPVSY